MISYTKRFVNVISLLITIVIYFFVTNVSINFCSQSIFNMFKKSVVQVELNSNSVNLNSDNGIEEKIEIQNDYPKNQIVTNEVIEDTKEVNWKILIPAIALEAEISEGTSKEIMDKYVGHFEETSKSIGNVGLAAHNRGYNVNYFANLKKLKEGDKIIYKCYGFERTYVVTKNLIITDEDWSYLEETEKNTITLITCVENEPMYRRCIQGEEI
jgi:LPXTG-site transpeptidase (sortase) family protein